ncbi:MAG: hypothetical protein N4A76_04445 [Firmicutes bacterium]|jgi:hypothetical protein|nr:hypothetical protein [Bacillota bacterium]
MAKGIRYNVKTKQTEEYEFDFVPQDIEEIKEPSKDEVIAQGMANIMIENQLMKEEIKDLSKKLDELTRGSES